MFRGSPSTKSPPHKPLRLWIVSSSDKVGNWAALPGLCDMLLYAIFPAEGCWGRVKKMWRKERGYRICLRRPLLGISPVTTSYNKTPTVSTSTLPLAWTNQEDKTYISARAIEHCWELGESYVEVSACWLHMLLCLKIDCQTKFKDPQTEIHPRLQQTPMMLAVAWCSHRRRKCQQQGYTSCTSHYILQIRRHICKQHTQMSTVLFCNVSIWLAHVIFLRACYVNADWFSVFIIFIFRHLT